MKAILLAGGRGTRISRFIGERPKCTLDIGGISLIRNTVELLNRNQINVTVVVGYMKDMVMEELNGINVKFFNNPFFDITNSIASLWFARNELKNDDIILANADVFWEQEILNEILNDNHEQVMLMDTSRSSDYLFNCVGSRLIDHGKNLKECTGEYVGIARIDKTFIDQFLKRLELLIDTQNHSIWWENVLYSFINELKVNVKDINGLFWSEIDLIEDFHRILEFRKSLNRRNTVGTTARLQ